MTRKNKKPPFFLGYDNRKKIFSFFSRGQKEMQAFTGRIDLPPLNVDQNQNKYDFLAFGAPVSSTRATEYMKAQSSDSPLFTTNSTGNYLFNTFAKAGIFDERYKDIANPVAYGNDYTVITPEKQVVDNGAFASSERPHYMVYTEKSNAYEKLGYQDRWQRKAQKTENSVVSRIDDSECMQGQMMVNNQCFATKKGNVSCPSGFVFDSESQFCVPDKRSEKQQATKRCLDPAAVMNEKGECIVKMM